MQPTSWGDGSTQSRLMCKKSTTFCVAISRVTALYEPHPSNRRRVSWFFMFRFCFRRGRRSAVQQNPSVLRRRDGRRKWTSHGVSTSFLFRSGRNEKRMAGRGNEERPADQQRIFLIFRPSFSFRFTPAVAHQKCSATLDPYRPLASQFKKKHKNKWVFLLFPIRFPPLSLIFKPVFFIFASGKNISVSSYLTVQKHSRTSGRLTTSFCTA